MKRLILAFALAASIVTDALIVLPEQATQAAAAPYGYYRYTDGVLIYTYLWQWPGIWTLVNVEPA